MYLRLIVYVWGKSMATIAQETRGRKWKSTSVSFFHYVCWWWFVCFVFVWFFWLQPRQAEVPKPGIKLVPQQWQHRILNPLSHQGTRLSLYVKWHKTVSLFRRSLNLPSWLRTQHDHCRSLGSCCGMVQSIDRWPWNFHMPLAWLEKKKKKKTYNIIWRLW